MKPPHQLDIYTVGDGTVDRSRLDHVTEIFRPTTLALLDRVGVRRGMACLDVGCGTAGVTFDLARLVGPEGSVVGLDTDAVRIEEGRREASALNLPNVEFRLADIRTVPDPVPELDLVYSRLLLDNVDHGDSALRAVLGLQAGLCRLTRPAGQVKGAGAEKSTTTRKAAMWGAIIGDIVGSVYEWDRIKTKDFEFFSERGHFTDDSVCTAAVADMLLHDRPPAPTLQAWCRRYPHVSYGGWFRQWIGHKSPEPYHSFGNGAAMRVSPAAFLNRDDLPAALAASDRVTEVTHDHPEGMKGARATVHAIWLALNGEDPAMIRATITAEYGYDLTRTVDEIRPTYAFNETCQQTVPESITCALESASFEDAIRSAVSLGGDSDTVAAIAGPVAEALHGIPGDVKVTAEERYLADAPDIVAVMSEMYGGG